MADNEDSSRLTIGQMLEIQLCSINAVIETVAEYGEPDPLFEQVRSRLLGLQEQLQRKQIQPEYAKAQLEEINDQLDQWREDNRIPND